MTYPNASPPPYAAPYAPTPPPPPGRTPPPPRRSDATHFGQRNAGAPAARPRRSVWVRLAALALIGLSLLIDVEALIIIPLLFVLVVPFEKLFPRHKQRLRRPALTTDMSYALASAFFNVIALVVAIPVAVISLAWIPGLLLRPLVAMIPTVIAPLVGLALFDLAIYWTHRWYHEVPILWRFHAIHHSTEHLDWISGFRNHPLDGTLIAPAAVFLVAAGFTAELTGILAVVQIALGLFLHANVRWRLRPLHKIVITPEFHHWHHANEVGAINSNYSVFLPAWDLLFGTYFMPADRRPQRYGVSEPIPDGMVPQLRHPFRGMPPLRRIFGVVLRHPIRSTKKASRLFLVHVARPIRTIGLRRRPDLRVG